MILFNLFKQNFKMTKRPFELNKCIICYDELETDDEIRTKCGHYYCVTCFVYHMRLSNQCGMCRTQIVPDKPKELPKMDNELIINMTDFIMKSFVYEDGLTSMYNNLTNKFSANLKQFMRQQNITVTRSIQKVIDKCTKTVNGEIRLEYNLWMYTLKCVKSMTRWYEEDSSMFITDPFINPSQLIDLNETDTDNE